MIHGDNEIHDLVKEKYAAIAEGKRGMGASSCCGGPTPIADIQAIGKILDYTG
jgi:bacterioferritin-associated ferredoxin